MPCGVEVEKLSHLASRKRFIRTIECDVVCLSYNSTLYSTVCMCVKVKSLRSDERHDPAYWSRTKRGAQNGCSGFPARRSSK